MTKIDVDGREVSIIQPGDHLTWEKDTGCIIFSDSEDQRYVFPGSERDKKRLLHGIMSRDHVVELVVMLADLYGLRSQRVHDSDARIVFEFREEP